MGSGINLVIIWTFTVNGTNNCTWNVKGDFPCSDIEVVFKQRPWVKKTNELGQSHELAQLIDYI